MAITFPYYYELAGLDSSYISDIWYEPAAGLLGDFTANSVGNVYKQLNNASDSFTAIFTYDKLVSASNPGAVQLLSSSNWIFGIDASNFLFLQAGSEAYTFDQITLGKKNCISLAKNDNAFTVVDFNIPSKRIEVSQTQFVSPSVDLSSTGLYFAGNTTQPGMKRFYGTVDQLVVLNQIISNDTLGTLFSGFLGQTIVYAPPSPYSGISHYTWDNSGILSLAEEDILKASAEMWVENFLDSNLVEGNYYGDLGVLNGPNFSAIGFLNSGVTYDYPCYNGNTTAFTPLTSIGYQNTLQTSVYSKVAAINATGSPYFSFDFSDIYPGLALNLTYEYGYENSSMIVDNTGYYSKFLMNGIVSERGDAVLLGKYDSSFDKVNNVGVFDVVKNLFYAPGVIENDRIFLDGLGISGYSKSGVFIDVANLIETQENKVIYDKQSTDFLSLLSFNTHNFTTGEFYPKSSVGFTGDQSFVAMYRTLEPTYLETSSIHLYHGKAIPKTGGKEINNLDFNWA